VAKLSKQNVFSDRRNLLYDKPASFRYDGRLFYSPGPAAANALSPKGWDYFHGENLMECRWLHSSIYANFRKNLAHL